MDVTGPINLPFRQAYGPNFYRKEERGLDRRLFGEFKPQSPTLVVKLPNWRLSVRVEFYDRLGST